MAALLSIIDVSFSRGVNTLFEKISLNINHGDIAGEEQPDTGEVRMPRGQRVALVEQFIPDRLRNHTLLESVLDVLPAELQQTDRYKADQLLQKLGFSIVQTELPLQALSGGQQNLALLARAILLEPELLLMDEPGNHMDVMAMSYLQSFILSDNSIPFLMISHDRELLNTCCTRTVFLRDKTLYCYDLAFDAAAEALVLHDIQAAKARQAEEKEIKRLQLSAKRLAHWGKAYDNEDLARKAKTMQKRVEHLKQEQTMVSKGSGLDLQLETDSLRSKSLLIIENLSITTPDKQKELLTIDFQHVRPGDRVALLGKNGVGKSSTINHLVNAIGDTADNVRFNPSVNLGFYDQELAQFETKSSRFDWLHERSDVPDDKVKQVLLQNGIPFKEFDHAVNTLSGGERARLMFMVFQLNKPNFLVLDEPTNHIDIQGREQLEQQLIESDVTLLLTSHDRRFIQHVANRWWWIKDETLIELNDLDEFYAVVEQTALSDESKTERTEPLSHSICNQPIDEDTTLARIEELEVLLKNDLMRKPKFQKPRRQQDWQNEINRLWSDLE